MEVTILELMFHFMKIIEPTGEVKRSCEECGEGMGKKEAKFNRLPKILFIQVPRLNKDGYTINTKKVDFSTKTLDLVGFVENGYVGETVYEFSSGICIND